MRKTQSLTGYCDCWTGLVYYRLNKMKDTRKTMIELGTALSRPKLHVGFGPNTKMYQCTFLNLNMSFFKTLFFLNVANCATVFSPSVFEVVL